MRDPKWMGTQPSNVAWSADSKTLYFSWNPDAAMGDSTYAMPMATKKAEKLTLAQNAERVDAGDLAYNSNFTQAIYIHRADIFWQDVKTGRVRQLTHTTDAETDARFLFGDTVIAFTRSGNLYSLHVGNGSLQQLTNFGSGGGNNRSGSRDRDNEQEAWLRKDQLDLFAVLQERKKEREAATAYRDALRQYGVRKEVNHEGKTPSGLSISSNGRYVTYRLFNRATGGKNTIVPSYVTESGFTEELNARTKVGSAQGGAECWIYVVDADTAYQLKADDMPGITDVPAYKRDYAKQKEDSAKKKAKRAISFGSSWWNPSGTYLVVNVAAQDNKDRWLMLLNPATGKMTTLDRQHDDAWIGGPGIGGFGGAGGWIDDNNFYYQSEASGYSHLYSCDVRTMSKKQLTTGAYEVQSVQLDRAKKYFYLTANKEHPGEKHLYKLAVTGGALTKLTNMTGANECELSPDEKWIAIRYSYSNKPWELYLQPNQPGAAATQLTNKAMSDELKSYAWRDPELVTFTAQDGATVYARLYKPAQPHAAKPAVIFVHGAGYLQNAHKWWSSYFREYMFHNLLADNGYTVLDIDYRASAGYGRDWRTGIYRFMGGKDLSDHVDGAQYLIEKHGIDPKRIGMYGGSYGGFITLMALFTEPGKFAAGAALRPVTDWAHYNHGYTSNILNTPVDDSIAYAKSSPIYHAAGLQDHLLICHGMLDVNVHFQDVVRLQQKLIELGKDNWELAAYPMEDHGFVEPDSWTDEYKRIFKLFERVLKR